MQQLTDDCRRNFEQSLPFVQYRSSNLIWVTTGRTVSTSSTTNRATLAHKGFSNRAPTSFKIEKSANQAAVMNMEHAWEEVLTNYSETKAKSNTSAGHVITVSSHEQNAQKNEAEILPNSDDK